MMKVTHRTWIPAVGVLAGALLLAGCGAAKAPYGGAGAPASGGSAAPVSAATGGGGAGDTSTSKVTNVCSAVTTADLDAAFGGTWDAMSGSSGPLTCAFDLTGNESTSAVAAGSAVEITLQPNTYATSGMALAQSVDGLGEQAGVLGNTLLIKRGADVIEILTMPYDASPKAQAAMVTLGKAIYPRF